MSTVRLSHFRFIISIMIAIFFVFIGCENETPDVTTPESQAEQYTVPQEIQNEVEELQKIASASDKGFSYWTNNSDNPPVIVPAGSVDALAAAIASAGSNGIVILKSGLHTENNPVTITSRVNIIGENGAILKSAVTPSTIYPLLINPAIHILNANKVKIWNVDFRPTGSVGGTAILLENSPKANISLSSFVDFQYAILLNNSNSSTIFGNNIMVPLGWQTGELPEAQGIVNVNGNHLLVANNEVSNGLIGVFGSGGYGFFLNNNLQGNFAGFVGCCVPEESFQFPGGAIVGSEDSGHHWFLTGNNATGNLHAGYLIIDGAHHNLLVNNAASNNGEYDIELAGETALFGFCTPTCFNNIVIAGRHRNILINDFGLNNIVIGGIRVNVPIVPCTL